MPFVTVCHLFVICCHFLITRFVTCHFLKFDVSCHSCHFLWDKLRKLMLLVVRACIYVCGCLVFIYCPYYLLSVVGLAHCACCHGTRQPKAANHPPKRTTSLSKVKFVSFYFQYWKMDKPPSELCRLLSVVTCSLSFVSLLSFFVTGIVLIVSCQTLTSSCVICKSVTSVCVRLSISKTGWVTEQNFNPGGYTS